MPDITPISHWIGFHLFILLLLAAELLFARRPGPPSQKKTQLTSIVSTILWVAAAFLFALFVLRVLGSTSATEYLAGYAIEEALSIDNLFVFLLLFRLFRIESPGQPRVLFWGVAGAIVMRGAFIAAGLGLLARFEWVSYLFAFILLFAAIRLLMPEKNPTLNGEPATPRWVALLKKIHPISLRTDRFFTHELPTPTARKPRLMITMLFLCLIAIEITDVVFALDSIPAVLSITRHPFLAYTSNIMAVMGLRSLYFLLIHLLAKLRFLHYGLAAVLAFAALKMLAAHWLPVGPLTSLTVIVALLGITIGLSVLKASPARH